MVSGDGSRDKEWDRGRHEWPRGNDTVNEEREDRMRLWGILIFGVIGAAATTYAVGQARRTLERFYSQVNRGRQSQYSQKQGGASASQQNNQTRDDAWNRYNQRVHEEYEEEMERVERIRRMQSVFNRERSKYKRSYEKWYENDSDAYQQQNFQREDWYWKTDKSYREKTANERKARMQTSENYTLAHHYEALGLDMLDTSRLNDLVYVYYNFRLWVKQLEIKIDAKAISLDEIDTTAAWRGEVEEPVIETALDWLEDSGDDHGISEDLDQDVSEDIQFHAESASVPPPERESQSEGDRPNGSTSSRPPLPVPSSRGHLSRGSSTSSRGRLTPVRGAHASRAPTPTARGKAVSTAITFARKKSRGNP